MTREQSFFIRTLSDHLNRRKTDDPGELDWQAVHDYASRHQVSGIIYTQAKSYMPPETASVFRQETIATYYFYDVREADFRLIDHAFREAGIPFFAIKGMEVAALYPDPRLRAMGDIDLVVHAGDREACHQILCRNGFESANRQDDREWQYYRNRLETELHDRLVYKESVNESGQEPFFNSCWDYVKNGQLEWNFHLLFLIFHIRKHLMNSGAGFRQFMDLAVTAEKCEIDWEWMKEKLISTGMYDFAGKCYGFVFRWFGIRVPITDDIDEIFFEDATQKIFVDGIFGFDNDDNADSSVINQIRKKRFHTLGMVRIAFRYIFLPLNDMKNIEDYRYLNKYPFLLPAAWIHRIAISIGGKKKKTAIHNLKKSFVAKDRIEKRNEMMEKWGL